MSRHAFFVCCDGLGIDWVSPERTPALHALAQQSLWCPDHRGVFPSVTRVSAASISTGCRPARHGLHGNRMALPEEGGYVVCDAGKPDFRARMRCATGGTLKVPTLAERVAGAGGFIGFSNVSPGAAYFLDPEHFGEIHHRAGSFAAGGKSLDPLPVGQDFAGDRAMTERFCAALSERRPAAAVLWLTNPDYTKHRVPLGSSQHLEALAAAEACVMRVAETAADLRRQGHEVLLAVGADHGHETTGDVVDLDGWLAQHGLAAELESGAVAMAGQGTAALFYATPEARPRLLGVLDKLRAEPWAGELLVGDALAREGFPPVDGVVAGLSMARSPETNDFGVPGRRWVVQEDKPAMIGCGQHGGWGPDEMRPFLLVNAPGLSGQCARPSSIVDIAPTLLDFLGLPTDGMDGRSLL
jgi:predicted AlkP superfamily pyrophosphatase or phosphodiesterase